MAARAGGTLAPVSNRVVVFLSVSLDGYIAGPGGDLSWHHVDEEVHQHFNDVLRGMGAFVSGRRNYELMQDFWPTADQDPDCPPTMRDFAAIWRSMPKVVFSRTLDRPDEGVTLVREVEPAAVRDLVASFHGDVTVGGAELAAAFAAVDLVDEYHLTVHPELVGGGVPLFPAGLPPRHLRLLETHTFGNGAVILRHEVVRIT